MYMKKEKYLAINIGPISQAMSMARKPREFWAASYLFSYLMQCILEKLHGDNKLQLISPCWNAEGGAKIGVGLYPDRAFYQVKDVTLDVKKNVESVVEEALKDFACKVNLEIQVVQRFFHIMIFCDEYDSSSEAIMDLNKKLNLMELNQTVWEPEDFNNLLSYIRKTTGDSPSPLFDIAFKNKQFPKETLEEIALAGEEKAVYSYQRYVCIVQADGDNMGSIVGSQAMEGKLNEFSKCLMDFGLASCQSISEYGGMPIYAGGDDLLFIAPVCKKSGNGTLTIFDLLLKIDGHFENVQKKIAEISPQKNSVSLASSMSYGISIIYYKYPLYEAWIMARSLLFDNAKKMVGKDAVALKIRKHSGSDFQWTLAKKSFLYKEMGNLIGNTPKEAVVSAIAHKFRANEPLLGIFSKDLKTLDNRLEAFYKEIMDLDSKGEKEQNYLDLSRYIFLCIYKEQFEQGEGTLGENEKLSRSIDKFYDILRSAKFFKGEEVKDE